MIPANMPVQGRLGRTADPIRFALQLPNEQRKAHASSGHLLEDRRLRGVLLAVRGSDAVEGAHEVRDAISADAAGAERQGDWADRAPGKQFARRAPGIARPRGTALVEHARPGDSGGVGRQSPAKTRLANVAQGKAPERRCGVERKRRGSLTAT